MIRKTPDMCSEDQYSKNGKCCSRCEAGTYKQKDCDNTVDTKCGLCGQGSFMDTRNYMNSCRQCKQCNLNLNLREIRKCTVKENTICACAQGFYCSEANCEHCRPVSRCPQGHGVKRLATGTNDTLCSPCEAGTFSNVSDHVSPCAAHTSCEKIGRVLVSPGTATSDAHCGDFIARCGWMLPAGLWIGLVLTTLLVVALVLFYWRNTRCGRHRTVSVSGPEAPVDEVPAEEVLMKLPLPSKELKEICQEETYRPSYSCELTLLEPDAVVISCDTQDHDVSTVPDTSTKVSFTESQLLNSSSRYSTGNYQRTISEPQEDEWCGT